MSISNFILILTILYTMAHITVCSGDNKIESRRKPEVAESGPDTGRNKTDKRCTG